MSDMTIDPNDPKEVERNNWFIARSEMNQRRQAKRLTEEPTEREFYERPVVEKKIAAKKRTIKRK